MLVFTTLALSLLSCAFAAPSTPKKPVCGDLSKATLVLPAGSSLPAPIGPPKFIGLGVGTQNYTCSDAGTYASAGAVATLYDISCLAGSPLLDGVADIAIGLWEKARTPGAVCSNSRINAPKVLGQHYFITNPITGSGISPKWDLGSAGFIVAAKSGGMPAPTGAQDVDWLALNGVQGSVATQVYRVDTKKGQPPASCTPGSSPLTVKYVSVYYLN